MDLVILGLFLCVFIFGLVWAIKTGSLQEPTETSATEKLSVLQERTETLATEKPSALRWLPIAFYVIAWLGFLGWWYVAINLKSWEAFGIGIGTTIACLGSGRVIELLQNIDDKLEQKRTSE